MTQRGGSIRGVVFDLFHTLVDPEDFRPPGFLRAAFAAELLGVDPEHFTGYWRGTSSERLRTRITLRGILSNYVGNEGLQVSGAKLDEIDREMCRFQHRAIAEPRGEVLEVLTQLKRLGLCLGLLSNTEEGEVRTWASSPLAGLFDSACMSFEIGFAKPEAEAFIEVARCLGIPTRDCAFVGDGGSDELKGAKNAGFGLVVFMRGFVRSNGLRTESELPELAAQADVTIDSLQELVGLFADRGSPIREQKGSKTSRDSAKGARRRRS